MRFRYVALWIILACLVTFILQGIFGTDLFVLKLATKWSEPWRIFTSMFAHAGVTHLLQNIFAIGLFGLILEGRIGPHRTALTYFTAGLLVNIFSPYSSSLGASGAAFGLIGTLAVLRPQFTIWFAGVPMPMFIAAILYAAIDVGGLFYPSTVAHLAHLGGLVIGIAYGLLWHKTYADRYKPFFKKRTSYDERLDRALDNWETRRGNK